MNKYIDKSTGNITVLVLAALLVSGYLQVKSLQKQNQLIISEQEKISEIKMKELAEASEWFEVKNIDIPNYIAGDDPLIVYNREIKKPFMGTWSVEIHQADKESNLDYPICTGKGENFYQPKEKLPKSGVPLSWFMGIMGTNCAINLPEGTYVPQLHLELRPLGYPTKNYDFIGNIFRVLPKGSQLYITPEQKKMLDSQTKEEPTISNN